MKRTLRVQLSMPLIAAGLFCFSQHAFTQMSGQNTAATPATALSSQEFKQLMAEKWENMTPAQKRQLHDQLEKILQNMTLEQKMELRAKIQNKWYNMTPEQKQMGRQKMQEKWQKMTPAEKKAAREKIATKLETMSPEERNALIQGQINRMEGNTSTTTQ